MTVKLKSLLAAAAFASATVTGAAASTFDATSVTSNGNQHSFYFAGGPFGGSAFWQFEGGTGSFSTNDDGSASLTGTIVQNGATDNSFIVDVAFSAAGGPENGIKCGGFSNVGDCNIAALSWDFFTFADATLEGVSGSVDGLDLTLANRVAQPIGQFGEGASDKPGGGLGFSDWFTWTVENNASGLSLASASGNGDINVLLAPVPLPAGGLLLISGLFGMGAYRKLRKS